ncbi:hypothetical protein CSC2_26040 [Clostridium zeae]|uniref:Uncharacterized protein n=1 Tax=Clostridium zeae TaxID=2759022 RepID=A0ABQ1EB82_9CLOT|nr:hypothetical protein CSC2_26040 [Clostridium zeae]
MKTKHNKNENSLNTKICTILIYFLWLLLAIVILGTFFLWNKTNSFTYVISGALVVIGLFINIHQFKKVKSNN